ncbi:DUF6599 family protein [Granulicella tundricola]|uniref:Uncharacterized protein n=1 Tax=Granulicella tundricola (strain ATCC BAA-1859 / DSM 23138 / MP5ACTX9) TaxID=1198114 RepID=E8WYK3_GRATM|nr:DUF6599 family protein [Granulicella tundricola]ADW67601.1 hypothetical protein AciX9_0529 [Granulicella tundricola MP5ACTX9]
MLAAVGAAGLLSGGAGAQQAPANSGTMLVMAPLPLLPQKLAGMTLAQTAAGVATDATAQEFSADCSALPMNPPPSAGGSGVTCAAVLKEDGLTRFASGSYARAAGAPVGVLALEFGDATGAYSAYTFYRSLMKAPRVTGGDARVGKAAETSSDADGSVAWAGTAIVRVTGRVAPNELTAIVSALPKVGGRRGIAPLLPTLLPEKGLEAATARYALGAAGYKAMNGVLPAEMLDWSKSTEAITAGYSAGGKGTVTLLMYPTPQIAGDRGRAVVKYINDTGPAQFGTVKMRRVGPLVGLTTGGLGATQAQELMTALHLSQDLSFDKPMPLEFHAEIRKTATLLQSIAIFCGIGTLAAIVLGVFLGGARAGIRVLQGKPAHSDPEFLTIDLRDKPKGFFAKKDEPKSGAVS